jgi:tRNA(Ile)-lysidine synthase
MKDIVSRVRNTIQENDLIKRGEKILLAVSGGADSIAMLFIMHELSKDLNFSIGVASFNHKIREEASYEIDFVRNIAKSLNLQFFEGEFDVLKAAKKAKRSVEDIARERRYEFLFGVKEKYGFQKISVAHNLDDFAETVMLHLIKGTGLSGLIGIKPISFNGIVIHPLIEIKKQDIEEYLKERNITYIVDFTNYSLDYLRNRIRHQIIPIILSVNPNFRSELYNLSKVIQEDDEFLNFIANRDLFALKIGEEFSLISFKGLPLFEKRRIMKTILGESASFERIERIIKEICEGKRKVNIAKDSYFVQNGKTFWIEQKAPFSLDKEHSLITPGKTAINEISLEIFAEIAGERPQIELDKHTVLFDLEKVSLPLKIRFRKKGDRVLIENGTKKLQDLFTDLKIKEGERHKIPLLVDSNGNILWVIGIRRSSLAKLSESTKKSLILKASFNKA